MTTEQLKQQKPYKIARGFRKALGCFSFFSLSDLGQRYRIGKQSSRQSYKYESCFRFVRNNPEENRIKTGNLKVLNGEVSKKIFFSPCFTHYFIPSTWNYVYVTQHRNSINTLQVDVQTSVHLFLSFTLDVIKSFDKYIIIKSAVGTGKHVAMQSILSFQR